jgi:glyceraldehyde 3-phosphate dehydrogenase
MVLFKINYWIKRKRIINLHQYAGDFVGKPITFDSVEIAKVVLSLDLPPSKLDIGKLTYEYVENEKYPDETFCIGQIKRS